MLSLMAFVVVAQMAVSQTEMAELVAFVIAVAKPVPIRIDLRVPSVHQVQTI